ncbi:hypothetical protein ACFL2X_07185 [Candidatus Latescibacterota bacterium]
MDCLLLPENLFRHAVRPYLGSQPVLGKVGTVDHFAVLFARD